MQTVVLASLRTRKGKRWRSGEHWVPMSSQARESRTSNPSFLERFLSISAKNREQNGKMRNDLASVARTNFVLDGEVDKVGID
jgi:hypothetical protein